MQLRYEKVRMWRMDGESEAEISFLNVSRVVLLLLIPQRIMIRERKVIRD